MRCRATHVLASLFALLSSPCSPAQTSATGLPLRLEQCLAAEVRPTEAEYKHLARGAPLARLLDADPKVEVAVFGAVWISAPIRRYVEAMRDIESFERGGAFKVTKRISSPPRLADFAELELPDEDIANLRTCKVGDCEVKLDAQALQRFRTGIDWKAPGARAAANALMRELMLQYVKAYLEGGNSRLAVYRDGARPTFVAREFHSMVDEMPELTTYMPDLRRYLLDYPHASLPNSTSFLYWQKTSFGLKPTIRISHLVITERREDTVVASKMLYATHYFWTALELRVLIPDPARGSGFWFVTVNRSRSDGLSGFGGRVIRNRVHREAREGMLAALNATKRKLEQAGRADAGLSVPMRPLRPAPFERRAANEWDEHE